MTACYGSFPGGDPRRFSPDPECSTDAEREAHRVACLRWDAGYRDEYPTHSFEQRGGSFVHVNRSAFGLGVYDGGAPDCERCLDSRSPPSTCSGACHDPRPLARPRHRRGVRRRRLDGGQGDGVSTSTLRALLWWASCRLMALAVRLGEKRPVRVEIPVPALAQVVPAVTTEYEARISADEAEEMQRRIAFGAAFDVLACRMRWTPKAKGLRS